MAIVNLSDKLAKAMAFVDSIEKAGTCPVASTKQYGKAKLALTYHRNLEKALAAAGF